MARVSMGYPDLQSELAMLDTHGGASPLDDLEPVADAAFVAKLIEVVRGVHVAPAVQRYAVDLVTATRQSPEVRLGGSPRATLHLVRAARAWAAIEDRDYVLPDDVRALAVPVLGPDEEVVASLALVTRTVRKDVTRLRDLGYPVDRVRDG